MSAPLICFGQTFCITYVATKMRIKLTKMQISHSSDMKNRSNVTNKMKNLRTTDIRPSSMNPARKSSVYRLIEADWDSDRARIIVSRLSVHYVLDTNVTYVRAAHKLGTCWAHFGTRSERQIELRRHFEAYFTEICGR